MASNESTGMPPVSKRSSSPDRGGSMPTPIGEKREPEAVLRWGALSFPGLGVADHLHGRRGRQSRGADRVPGNP